jgi:DNA-binding response OmpR family regulator
MAKALQSTRITQFSFWFGDVTVIEQKSSAGAPTACPVILIIDDESNLLKVRQLVLASAGYRVLTAETGKAALEVFRRNPVDLVISDQLLPDKSGAQIAVEMKHMKPNIPIILLTGLSEAPEGAEHADLFLTKGLPVPEFLANVAKLLGGTGAAPAVCR